MSLAQLLFFGPYLKHSCDRRPATADVWNWLDAVMSALMAASGGKADSLCSRSALLSVTDTVEKRF